MANKFAQKRNAIRNSNINRQLEEMETTSSQASFVDAQRIAYENRINPDADGASKVMSRQAREELFTRNFRWIDIRELIPNDKNFFDINDGDIAALADLIQLTGYTDPIIVREVDRDGKTVVEIVDGERRMRAHLRLAETVDPIWYMIPARYYRIGELSDEQVEFFMSAENIGQRDMSPSNRALAFAAVADVIVAHRLASDPGADAEWVKSALAEQFGVSERTVQYELNIGRHLVDKGLVFLDKKRITKAAADALATLPPESQYELLEQIEQGALQKSDVEGEARERSDKRKSSAKRSPKSFDSFITSATRSLRKAARLGETASRKDLATLRDLLDEIDPDLRN